MLCIVFTNQQMFQYKPGGGFKFPCFLGFSVGNFILFLRFVTMNQTIAMLTKFKENVFMWNILKPCLWNPLLLTVRGWRTEGSKNTSSVSSFAPVWESEVHTRAKRYLWLLIFPRHSRNTSTHPPLLMLAAPPPQSSVFWSTTTTQTESVLQQRWRTWRLHLQDLLQ